MATVLPEPYGTEPLVTDSVVVKNPEADLKVYPDLYAAGSEPLDANDMRLTVLDRPQTEPRRVSEDEVGIPSDLVVAVKVSAERFYGG